MNNQNAVKLLADEVWENDHDDPLGIGKTWTRVLIWDTRRAEDRYVRQDMMAYGSAHSDTAGQLDWDQYQNYLDSETSDDWGEVVFEVCEVSEVHVYDEDYEDGFADCDYRYPFDVAYDELKDAEKAAENYVRNLNPEHLKPII